MSKIRFKCFNPECEKSYKVPKQYAGKKVKCKKCDRMLKVPPEDGGNSNPASEARAKPGSDSRNETRKTSAREVLASSSGSGRKAVQSETTNIESKTEKKPEKVNVKGTSKTGTVMIEVPDIRKERKNYENKKENEERERGKGMLLLFKNGKPTKSFRVEDKTYLIGRSSRAQIRIEDETVSKKHCKLEQKLGNFIMTDLKSSNGLVVNDKPIRRVSLRNGDVIQLGQAVLRIDCG